METSIKYTKNQTNQDSDAAESGQKQTAPAMIAPSYFARFSFVAAICLAAIIGPIAMVAYNAGLLKGHPFSLAFYVLVIVSIAGGLLGYKWTTRHIDGDKKQQEKDRKMEDKRLSLELKKAEIELRKPIDPTGLEAIIATYRVVLAQLTIGTFARRGLGLTPADHGNAIKILREIGIIGGQTKGTKFIETNPQKLYELLATLRTDDKDAARIWFKDAAGQKSILLESENGS